MLPGLQTETLREKNDRKSQINNCLDEWREIAISAEDYKQLSTKRNVRMMIYEWQSTFLTRAIFSIYFAGLVLKIKDTC
jgi:hypothetical protein